MLLCRKNSHRPAKARVGRAVWVDLPCQILTRQSFVKHGKSNLMCVQFKW